MELTTKTPQKVTAKKTTSKAISDSQITLLYNRDFTYDLGEAVNIKDPGKTIQNKILKINPVTSDLLEQDFDVHLITSVEQLRFSLNTEIKFASSLKSWLSAEAKMDIDYFLDERNLTLVFTGYTYKKREEANIANFDELKSKYEEDPYRFHDLYGTHYVEHIQYGHYIYLIVTLGNVDRRFKAELEASGGYAGFEAKLSSFFKWNKVSSTARMICKAIGYENFPYAGFIKDVATKNLTSDKFMLVVKQTIGEYLEKLKTDKPQRLRYELRSFNNALLNNDKYIKWSNQHENRLTKLKTEFKRSMLYQTELTKVRDDDKHPYRSEFTAEELNRLDDAVTGLGKHLDELEEDHTRLLENKLSDLNAPVPVYRSSMTGKIAQIKQRPVLGLYGLVDDQRIGEVETNNILSETRKGKSVIEIVRKEYGPKVKDFKMFITVDGYKLAKISCSSHWTKNPPKRVTSAITQTPFTMLYPCNVGRRFDYDQLEGHDCEITNQFGDKVIIPMSAIFVQS